MDSFGDDSIGLEDPASAEEELINKDVPTLYKRWQNEKYAPELLPFDKQVVDNISEVVEFVNDLLEDERTDNDLDPNDVDHLLRGYDLERVRYVLRDYLRIRLWKITQWPQHYSEPTNLVFLSDPEKAFLREYVELKTNFFDHRLLCAFPASKKGLDDRLDLLDMIRRPDLDKFVYIRVTGDVDPIDVPPTLSQGTPATQEPLQLQDGQKYLLRYSIVRKFLLTPDFEGKVVLI
eukprot:TRINITY_DN8699_c0_g1_i1.p2 TRINITY_DN8699_c0_g1~~TRINITY_DN8699_c0_g1_i1.p2  ORF type:complete len:234 (-),score=74.32 TRINITY_DN8699_c0_g1_i1:192-893(-)